MPSHSTVTRQQYQEHYDKGLPLWTREDLEDIERQLKERSERMTVKDIDNSFIVDNIDLAVAAADANKLKKILGIGDDVEM